jgi:phosphatidylserine/phosphatidylglycerophosphate/cardiolipin synthase-like enzyme
LKPETAGNENMGQEKDPANVPAPTDGEGASPLAGARAAAEEAARWIEPEVRQFEKDIDSILADPAQKVADALVSASAAARQKASEASPAAKSGDEPTPGDFTGQKNHQENSVPPTVVPLQANDWFLQQGYQQKVHFPARHNNHITAFFNSQDCLKEIAHAIKEAKKSISIITWGVDTDMRLEHKGIGNEHYRTMEYIKRASAGDEPFYPAAQAPEEKDFQNRTTVAATPDRDSYVLSDLLTTAAKRGVKVWLLVWEPSLMAKNVIDPLHLWWRSKTGMVENMEFAFRAYEGEQMTKPSKVYLQSDDTGDTKLLAQTQEKLEDLFATAQSDKYGLVRTMLLYTHHQKEILIDIEDSKHACGFIVGFNLKEEYWDSSQHSATDEARFPYAPWQDLGIKVCGPVLRDMAQNFEESWRQMHAKGPRGLVETTAARLATQLMARLPWATEADVRASEEARQKYDAYGEHAGRDVIEITNEIYPEHLIGAALAAGLGEEAKKVLGKNVLAGYDAKSYAQLIKDGYLELGTPEQWDYRLAPQCMELCHVLTTLSMIFYGLMTKSFLGAGMLRPSELWDLPIPEADALHVPENAPLHTAQFFRTFPLTGMPKEVSIFQAYLQAIRKVQAGQLIYSENQYFRDEYIVGEIISQHKKGVKFSVVIVANPLTDLEGKFLAAENIPGEGPMKLCIDRLKKADVAFCICWLRVKEQSVPEYAAPRAMPTLGYLIGLLGKADLIGDVDWSQRFDVAMKCRNHLFDACYPYLLAKDGQGGSRAQNFDEQYNARINQAVKDYQSIKETFEKLKPQVKSLETIYDALLQVQHDMTVAAYSHAVDAFAQELDSVLKELVKVIDEWADKQAWDIFWAQPGRRYERWYYNIRDFFGFAGDRPRPFIEQDPYYQEIHKEMEGYWKQKKPASKRSRFGSLPGHIYVHSKLMIVDGTYAIIGSANINERSMWHDSEVALGFRASSEGSVPREMLKTLFQAHFNRDPPETKEAFVDFSNKLIINDSIYNKGNPEIPLSMHALPLVMREVAVPSPGGLG